MWGFSVTLALAFYQTKENLNHDLSNTENISLSKVSDFPVPSAIELFGRNRKGISFFKKMRQMVGDRDTRQNHVLSPKKGEVNRSTLRNKTRTYP